MVYIEFGLSIPRYQGLDGLKQPVPRSGGEKNYVSAIARNRPCLNAISNIYFS